MRDVEFVDAKGGAKNELVEDSTEDGFMIKTLLSASTFNLIAQITNSHWQKRTQILPFDLRCGSHDMILNPHPVLVWKPPSSRDTRIGKYHDGKLLDCIFLDSVSDKRKRHSEN